MKLTLGNVLDRLLGECDRSKLLRAALLKLKHRELSDGPCWCFLWPDEEDEAEAIKGPGGREAHWDGCLQAREAIRA